jgi:site-specific DNA-cytosine methylase
MPDHLHYSVADIFSGAGGLELGFEQAGFNILFSTDIDEYCEKVHLRNRPNIPFVRADIHELSENMLDKYVETEIDILVGGPPCQGFSTIGKRISSDPQKRAEKDPRNALFREYIRILKHIKPKIFLMENVSGLLTRDRGGFLRILSVLLTKPAMSLTLLYSMPQITVFRRYAIEFSSSAVKLSLNLLRQKQHIQNLAKHRGILWGMRLRICLASNSTSQ